MMKVSRGLEWISEASNLTLLIQRVWAWFRCLVECGSLVDMCIESVDWTHSVDIKNSLLSTFGLFAGFCTCHLWATFLKANLVAHKLIFFSWWLHSWLASFMLSFISFLERIVCVGKMWYTVPVQEQLFFILGFSFFMITFRYVEWIRKRFTL